MIDYCFRKEIKLAKRRSRSCVLIRFSPVLEGAVSMNRDIQCVGLYADITDAPSPVDPRNTVKLGVRSSTFRAYGQRCMATAIAQYYGIVQDQLGFAKHVFRGLKRPLMLDADENADEAVLVYTWRSVFDCVWDGDPFHGSPRTLTPPPGRVFVVIVREEQQPNDHGIYGSIERWNWVREDPELPHSPIDWEQRYGEKLWSLNS